MYKDVKIIAEVKIKSPTRPDFTGSFEEQIKIAQGIADIFSIHTNPKWGGSFDLVRRAREILGKDKLILAKGLHETADEIRFADEAGADYILVVSRTDIPEKYMGKCWIEPLNLDGLRRIPSSYDVVVWNERDLAASLAQGKEIWKLDTTGETFEQARALWKGKLCQASSLRTKRDIKPGANYVLVGSYLKEFADSLRK